MEAENLKTEKRGVQKGTKRGPYKKNVIKTEPIKNDIMTAEINEPINNTFEQTTGEQNLDDFLNEYQEVATEEDIKNQQVEKQQIQSTVNEQKIVINGFMLLAMCDFIFPLGFKFLYGFFDARAKQVQINDIKLSNEQKEALTESADQVAQYIFQKANPLVIFGVCMALFYGTNFMTALNNIPKEPKLKK